MENRGDIIILNIRKLISDGLYEEAYKYTLENKNSNPKHDNAIHCFRYLLGCVTGNGKLETTHFSWESKKQEETLSEAAFNKIKSHVDCQHNMFKELRELCAKNTDI